MIKYKTMTNEEKQLLIKDLCARLPYGVKLNFYSRAINENIICALLGIEPDDDKPIIAKTDKGCFCFTQDHIKPYLRPMSSMTKEEREIYESLAFVGEAKYVNPTCCSSVIGFLEEKHLDYNHFIEKGLALEATEGMYN